MFLWMLRLEAPSPEVTSLQGAWPRAHDGFLEPLLGRSGHLKSPSQHTSKVGAASPHVTEEGVRPQRDGAGPGRAEMDRVGDRVLRRVLRGPRSPQRAVSGFSCFPFRCQVPFVFCLSNCLRLDDLLTPAFTAKGWSPGLQGDVSERP